MNGVFIFSTDKPLIIKKKGAEGLLFDDEIPAVPKS
jgi:hypothetical protein